MAEEWFESQAKLVLNSNKKINHVTQLLTLINTASSFECMSAFASESGLKLIYRALTSRLEKGLSARFVLGIDFFQTDPAVLYDLLKLSESYTGLELYMGNAKSKTVFHPKVYAFEDKDGNSCVMLGSANLTRGGLSNNHELSTYLTAKGTGLTKNVSAAIDHLKYAKEVVTATTELIGEYEVQHREHAFHQALARKRAQLAKPSTVESMDKLKAMLDVMKLEPSKQNPRISTFDEQVRRRTENRLDALEQLRNIAGCAMLTKVKFLAHYEPLVVEHLWHSGGLHRHRAEVAGKAKLFQQALRMLELILDSKPGKFTPESIFGPLLDKFKDIPHAGVNIMTEVLHTYDNDNFAIMNQNSVSGLLLANITGFPRQPTKITVSAEKYVRFCKKGREVRDALGLRNFTELDALLNFAYWR